MDKNKLKIGEFSRLGCECPEPGYCYTIEHGGYKPQDIDIEYCEKVTKKGTDSALIKFKDIPVVPLAACLKVFGPYDKLYDNYVELFAYLEKEGYKIVAAPRAVYIDGIWNQEVTWRSMTTTFAANNPQILRFICRKVLYSQKI